MLEKLARSREKSSTRQRQNMYDIELADKQKVDMSE